MGRRGRARRPRPRDASPEARLAAAAFRAVEADRRAELSSGARADASWPTPASPGTSTVAAELDVSDVVPVLDDGEFRGA